MTRLNDAETAQWHLDCNLDGGCPGWAMAALLGNGWRACAWGIRSGIGKQVGASARAPFGVFRH
jgi:hypothetical protein